jgi:hypothetical protein
LLDEIDQADRAQRDPLVVGEPLRDVVGVGVELLGIGELVDRRGLDVEPVLAVAALADARDRAARATVAIVVALNAGASWNEVEPMRIALVVALDDLRAATLLRGVDDLRGLRFDNDNVLGRGRNDEPDDNCVLGDQPAPVVKEQRGAAVSRAQPARRTVDTPSMLTDPMLVVLWILALSGAAIDLERRPTAYRRGRGVNDAFRQLFGQLAASETRDEPSDPLVEYSHEARTESALKRYVLPSSGANPVKRRSSPSPAPTVIVPKLGDTDRMRQSLASRGCDASVKPLPASRSIINVQITSQWLPRSRSSPRPAATDSSSGRNISQDSDRSLRSAILSPARCLLSCFDGAVIVSAPSIASSTLSDMLRPRRPVDTEDSLCTSITQ